MGWHCSYLEFGEWTMRCGAEGPLSCRSVDGHGRYCMIDVMRPVDRQGDDGAIIKFGVVVGKLVFGVVFSVQESFCVCFVVALVCASFFGDEYVLTGSQDKTLRLWKSDQCVASVRSELSFHVVQKAKWMQWRCPVHCICVWLHVVICRWLCKGNNAG